MSVSLLYLKVIDLLTNTFMKIGILEKVINNMKEIKVPEALYKPVKALKLKLIKAADTKYDKKKGEEEKGFGNFLNDKMNMLKEALENKGKIKAKIEVSFNPQTGQYEPFVSPSNTQKSIVWIKIYSAYIFEYFLYLKIYQIKYIS